MNIDLILNYIPDSGFPSHAIPADVPVLRANIIDLENNNFSNKLNLKAYLVF
jgi:hypothetical protein